MLEDSGVSFYGEAVGWVLVPYYTVNVEVVTDYTVLVNATGGTVTGDGVYARGELVELEAIPNTGYGFDGWYENDIKISSQAELSFNAITSRSFVAKFIPSGGAAAPVFIYATAGSGGTISSGGGIYDYGDPVTLIATPDSGYTFDGWYENNVKITGSATYNFIAEDFRMLEARFI
jgi:hypothetical protein